MRAECSQPDGAERALGIQLIYWSHQHVKGQAPISPCGWVRTEGLAWNPEIEISMGHESSAVRPFLATGSPQAPGVTRSVLVSKQPK